MTKTDSQLRQSVLHELDQSPELDDADIDVDVDAGVVTLTGRVSDWKTRLAAQDVAHRAPGAADVANELEIAKPDRSRRTDAEIAHAVRHTLQASTSIDDTRIRSTVSRGWVTLEGNVDNIAQQANAERTVRNTGGVEGVLNLLELRSAAI